MSFFSPVRFSPKSRLISPSWFLFLLPVYAAPLSAQTVSASSPIGVVVESVKLGSAAGKAGLQAGDVLLWYADRPLNSAFGFLASQENVLGTAFVKIKGRRGNQEIEVEMPRKAPGLQVCPRLVPAALTRYEAGEAEAQKGHKEAAEAAWREAANLAKEAGDRGGEGWLYWRAGESCGSRGAWKEAQQWQERAWNCVQNENDPAAQARIRRTLGMTLYVQGDAKDGLSWIEAAQKQNVANDNKVWLTDTIYDYGEAAYFQRDWKKAESYYKEAIDLRLKQDPESIDLIYDLVRLGMVLVEQKNYSQARDAYERALAIKQKQAPDSHDMANILSNLAIVAFYQQAWADAEVYDKRALVILRKENDTVSIAATLSNLGDLNQRQKKFSEARKYYEEALPFYQTHRVDTLETAVILQNLGMAAIQMSDPGAAKRYIAQSLKIQQKYGPTSIGVSACLACLGAVAQLQGELTEANNYFLQSLTMVKPLISLSVEAADQAATDYVCLGTTSVAWGDLATAKEYYVQAHNIIHRLAPASLQETQINLTLSLLKMIPGNGETAGVLSQQALELARSRFPNSLEGTAVLDVQSMTAAARSQWKEAQQYALESLTIREKLRPGSLAVVTSHQVLGYIAQKQANLPAAQQHFEKALVITRVIAPESHWHTLALGCLGNVLMKQQRTADALRYFSQATDLIERQRQSISVPESRALLLEQYAEPFIGLMEAQITLKREEDAFTTLERTRARSLVEMLGTRDAITRFMAGADMPADLRQEQQELSKRRVRLTWRQNLYPGAGETKRISAELGQIDTQQRALEAAIYRAAPRYASLQYPKPLSFPQAQQALDNGTLLLAYALGEKNSYLFALTKTSLKVHILPAGKVTVEGNVKHLLEALQSQGNYQQEARHLYQDLLKPAQAEINAAKRLLICPDGVLHTLPFAALVISEPNRPVKHLIETKPLHTVVSLGLYRQLRANPSFRSGPILALADPDRSIAAIASEDSGTAKQSADRQALAPLPQTRQQIKTLKQLYGKQVLAHEGKAATPTAFRKECAQACLIHLACHGITNDTDPLASALALSPDGSEDKGGGWLTAYDILGVRLRADLVMLSACGTGLGKPTEFEGLEGLTRAFQYAGARSVGVSLWNVDADSTTALMQRFYPLYHAGQSKDIALQQAQVASLHDRSHPQWQHPYFWAAFQLVGDWK